MDLIESLKILNKILETYPCSGREWNKINKAVDRVAAELGYEFRADGTVVCVKPEREEV